MGAERLVLVRCSKVCRCSRAASALPERCRARARPNSADACSGLQTQHRFELGDGFVVLLLLRIHRSQEVVRVGIVGIDLQDALKCFDRLGRLALTAPQQAEVVPDARIGRFLGRRRVERLFRLGQLLQIQQGDSLVQFGRRQARIGFQRQVEFLHRFVHALLVHVGDAEIVQLGCLSAVRRLVGRRCRYGNEPREEHRQKPAQGPHVRKLPGCIADSVPIIAAAWGIQLRRTGKTQDVWPLPLRSRKRRKASSVRFCASASCSMVPRSSCMLP